MNMYISQKMQVRFSNVLSSQFTVGNGVKQGGVLSPILFTVYLDSLIKTLKQRNIGCKIGNKFLRVFGYADDLTLLCPTLSGLQEMLNVCEDFAKDYNILFNASKSKLMYFGKNNLNCENLLCMSNGSSIEFVEQCVHLGTKIYSDISKKNIDNATNDLYMRTNNLMADFSYAQSSALSVLYNSYCMNVYESQLWCFNDYKSVECFYIAWRKTIRRIWRLDKRTHNVLINLINRCLPINLILEKRCVKYIWNLFNSSHELHKTIVRNCFYNKGSTLAENIRYLMYKYDITINDWHQSLNYVIKKVYAYDNDRTNCNDTCTANVIRELCHDRDTYHYPVNKDACSEFNDFLKALCTL